MLHALIHKKSRGRMPIEDEITSCIFGPLRFMTPDMRWRYLRVLFGHPEQLQDVDPIQVDVELWPQWHTAYGGRVEPDVYIIARREEDTVATIIVEVKQVDRMKRFPSIDRDALSRQLSKQWGSPNFCLTDHSLHVFLGHGLLDEDKSAIQELHEHLHIVSWHGLAKSLEEFNIFDIWRGDMLAFLKALGVLHFNGFNIFHLVDVDEVGWQFQNQWEPRLQAVGQLDWQFNL